MRRQLGTGVKVMEFSKLDPDHRVQPTDTQVRDALARCTRELNDMVLARGQDWTVEDESFSFAMVDGGDDLVLRGSLIITDEKR